MYLCDMKTFSFSCQICGCPTDNRLDLECGALYVCHACVAQAVTSRLKEIKRAKRYLRLEDSERKVG